jgi:pteridine reductase
MPEHAATALTLLTLVFYALGIASTLDAIMKARTPQGAIAWSVSLFTFPFLALQREYGIVPTGQIKTRIQAFLGRLDILVNNASSFYPTPLGEVDEAQWDDLMASNLKGPFFLAQAAAPLLRQSGGCIVNLVDIHAERPHKDYPVYSIAKAGNAMMVKALARELGPSIRVNGVAPGIILWPEGEDPGQETRGEILSRIVLGRPGSPGDIARAVLFLVQEADYITGQIIAVDGGRTLQQ